MADAHWPVAQPVLFDQSHMMPRQFVANEPYQKALAEADNRMSPPQDTPLYDEEDFRVSHTQEEMAEKVLIELVKEQKVLYEPSDGDSGEISSIQMNMWEDIAEKMRKAGFESFTGLMLYIPRSVSRRHSSFTCKNGSCRWERR